MAKQTFTYVHLPFSIHSFIHSMRFTELLPRAMYVRMHALVNKIGPYPREACSLVLETGDTQISKHTYKVRAKGERGKSEGVGAVFDTVIKKRPFYNIFDQDQVMRENHAKAAGKENSQERKHPMQRPRGRNKFGYSRNHKEASVPREAREW